MWYPSPGPLTRATLSHWERDLPETFRNAHYYRWRRRNAGMSRSGNVLIEGVLCFEGSVEIVPAAAAAAIV